MLTYLIAGIFIGLGFAAALLLLAASVRNFIDHERADALARRNIQRGLKETNRRHTIGGRTCR